MLLGNVHLMDFRELAEQIIQARAGKPPIVDMVFSDPCFHKQHIWQYRVAAELAKTILKPGGFAVFESGHKYLMPTIDKDGEHIAGVLTEISASGLSFFWSVANVYGGTDPECTAVECRGVRSGWTPFWLYTKGPVYRSNTPLVNDVFTDHKEKDLYWLQDSLDSILHVMEVARLPKDAVVVDFFCGSGTVEAACLWLNHHQGYNIRWVGCDINPEAIAIAQKRIAKIQSSFEKGGVE